MRKLRIAAAIAALVMIVSATSAFALDGTRKGFILGFGVGAGYQSYSAEIDALGAPPSESEGSVAFATDFRIGGGITEQFTLYYENRVAWFTVTDKIWIQDFTAIFGVGLLGASYYFKTEAPSGYILGSIGTSAWMFPFEDDTGTAGGFGISGGAGYEFARHWAFEATVNWGQPKDDPLTISGIAFLVTVGGTWY
jgi:hypothetical protein